MVLSPAVTPAVFDALRRAPGPANDEREEGLGSLTAREREVLNLLARGLSNRDIAEELVITNKTVKNHLSRIYEKIGVALPGRGDRALARRRRALRPWVRPLGPGVPREIGTLVPPPR